MPGGFIDANDTQSDGMRSLHTMCCCSGLFVGMLVFESFVCVKTCTADEEFVAVSFDAGYDVTLSSAHVHSSSTPKFHGTRAPRYVLLFYGYGTYLHWGHEADLGCCARDMYHINGACECYLCKQRCFLANILPNEYLCNSTLCG